MAQPNHQSYLSEIATTQQRNANHFHHSHLNPNQMRQLPALSNPLTPSQFSARVEQQKKQIYASSRPSFQLTRASKRDPFPRLLAKLQPHPFFSFIKEINSCFFEDPEIKSRLTEKASRPIPMARTRIFELDAFLFERQLTISNAVQKNKVDYLSLIYEQETRKIANFLLMKERELVDTSLPSFPAEILEKKRETIRTEMKRLQEELHCRFEAEMVNVLTQEVAVPRNTRSLSDKANEALWNWFTDHFDNPYPTKEEKIRLAYVADLSFKQVETWFANHRERYKKKYSSRTKKAEKAKSRKRKRRTPEVEYPSSHSSPTTKRRRPVYRTNSPVQYEEEAEEELWP